MSHQVNQQIDPPAQQADLRQIQRWMQNVITHPLGVAAGIESPEASRQIPVSAAELQSVVTRSQRLDGLQRLEVYANAYFARLLECMRESFPAMVGTLGAELFDEFAFGYLQAHPSNSYTLHRLADRFVDYLRETRPDAAAPRSGLPADDASHGNASHGNASHGNAFHGNASHGGASGRVPDWPEFVIDLARLESAFEEVFDGPGLEQESPLSADALLAIPPDQWAEARLEPAPCLRLMSFAYPVNTFYTRWRRGEPAEIPPPEPSYLAVSRRDYVVRRYELASAEHQLLEALAEGRTVGAAIEEVAGQFDDIEKLGETLGQWFQKWGAAQLFWRIRE